MILVLYFSRILDNGQYGVVDTDDDVEEGVTWPTLMDLVLDYKLPIEGVEAYRNERIGDAIGTVTPYQDPRYCTAAQAKAKTLLGVDIRIFRNEVTFIEASGNLTKTDTRIRLSDYGTSMYSRIEVGWDCYDENKRLILVLDDKFTVFGPPIVLGMSGVCWDVSEVSSDDWLKAMWDDGMARLVRHEIYWKNCLIDSKQRYRAWR